MRVHNVHTREITAPPEDVGVLLDGLGSEHDRLWPTDRWPTTPFELDGPLAVGTRSSQGQIHQVVQQYEPGRLLVLRFAPGLGLVDTHRLELEPVGSDRTRLIHTLDCRVEPKLLPLYPILIRQHDVLVEDLFDRAQLVTTGHVDRPARWPLSVRLANAAEVRIAVIGSRWRRQGGRGPGPRRGSASSRAVSRRGR